MSFTKTRPVVHSIGVRKAPRPEGCAGYIRIDSVHQGDLEKVKGVYHITSVDNRSSQWEVVACAQGISEAYLLPVLHQLLDQYPFKLRGCPFGQWLRVHQSQSSRYVGEAAC